MQELLTGKRRLPGFATVGAIHELPLQGHDTATNNRNATTVGARRAVPLHTGDNHDIPHGWEVKRLGDCGTFLKGSGVKKDEAKSGELPCVRYGEIYTHHNDYIKSFNSWISAEVALTATKIKQGDLLFAGSGETKEEIGKCIAFVGDVEAYAGGDIVILRLVDADPMFMGYYCNTPNINAQKASKGQGDAVVHISASALSSITACLPPLPEQTSIAAILSDMDTEIEALEQKRDKTRLLKQGMMQELLTGRIRLV